MFNAFSITNNDMSKMIAMSNTNYDILVEIVNEVIGNGGPSGVFDTLQELNDRYPKGAKGVYLVTVNGKWYYWNGSEWVAGGVYQATQLADGSVTDVKLDIDLQHKINSIEGIGQEAEKANVDLASHKASSQAHSAAAITYSGQVQASDVKEAIDKTNARISNIVAQSGNDNTEIRDARGGFNVLGDRLNSTDEQLADIANGISHITKGDLSPLVKSNGKTVVVTGDSLSFNRHPFVSSTVGTNDAYSYRPGLLSWSHMLRDAIHRSDDYFISVKDLLLRTKNTAAKINYFPNASAYTLAFNGIVAELQTSDNTEEYIFLYKHANKQTNKAYIYMAYNPLNSACSFDVYVDGVYAKNVDNNGAGKPYQGLDTFVIEVDMPSDNQYHEIKLTNFVQTASSPDSSGLCLVFIYGIGSKHTNVYLTGRGGTTSQWMMENVQSRILDYNPDVVFLVEGANDIFNSMSVTDFSNNIQTTINAIRTNKPDTEIVLMSTTRMSGYSYDLIRSFADTLRDLAQNNGCYFIDLIKLFDNLATSFWRIDNVHMTIEGNDMLAATVMSLAFNGLKYPKELMSGREAIYNANKKYSVPIEVNGYARIQYSTTTGDFTIPIQSSEQLLVSATKISDSRIRLTFRANTVMTVDSNVKNGFIYNINVKQFFTGAGVPGIDFNIIVGGWDKNEAIILLKKLDGTALTSSDWSTYANDFRFVVSY